MACLVLRCAVFYLFFSYKFLSSIFVWIWRFFKSILKRGTRVNVVFNFGTKFVIMPLISIEAWVWYQYLIIFFFPYFAIYCRGRGWNTSVKYMYFSILFLLFTKIIYRNCITDGCPNWDNYLEPLLLHTLFQTSITIMLLLCL